MTPRHIPCRGVSFGATFYPYELYAVPIVLVVTERCQARSKSNHVMEAGEGHDFYNQLER